MDSSRSVLLIEDDVPLARSTDDLLTMLGFDVTWKANATQATAALCSPHHFSVVLLDLNLGAERGEQIIQDARSRGCLIPPVVIFSAQPERELTLAAQSSRAAGILRKPCSASAIQAAIENALA